MKENWINTEPTVKEFVKMAKQYYTGAVEFAKNGAKRYTAKLDPTKLKLANCKCNEAYFDINRVKKAKSSKDIFVLRLIDEGNETNITLM